MDGLLSKYQQLQGLQLVYIFIQNITIRLPMGNIGEICEGEHLSPSNQQELISALQKQIVANRIQLKDNPRAPTFVQKIICQMLQLNTIEDLWSNSKIWRVKTPFNFCYINEPAKADMYPINRTSIFVYRDKGEFSGFFHGVINQKGERDTQGALYVYENGDYFVGDKEKTNFGKYIDEKNQYTYEGQWYNQLPHGKGIEKTPKGIFQGLFFEGQKHQKGTYKFLQNNSDNVDQCLTYQGQFKNNQMTGEGKLFDSRNQYEYIGNFLKGQKHGFGIQQMKNASYQGQYYMNKKAGSGKLNIHRSGVEYSGEFFNDMPNGKGKMKDKYKQVEGIWKNGEMVALLEKIN